MKSLTNSFTKIALCLSSLCSLSQAAPSGFYIELGGGLGLSDTIETTNRFYVYDQGYLASASLGYQIEQFRFEFEERYKSDNLYSLSTGSAYAVKVDGTLSTNSQMFNLYYSGYNQSNLITSIGFGVGVSSIDIENIETEESIFSAQAILSIGYQITEYFISTLKYSYFYTTESGDFQAKGDNTIAINLRYIF